MGGIEVAGEHEMGGDFVQVGGNGGVDVNVHAGHGALLKSGEGFTPGHGGGVHAEGLGHTDMNLGSGGADLHGLGFGHGVEWLVHPVETGAEGDPAHALDADLFKGAAQFLPNFAVKQNIDGVVVGHEVGKVEDHQFGIVDGQVGRGFLSELQHAELQALYHGFKVAEGVVVEHVDTEAAIGLFFNGLFELAADEVGGGVARGLGEGDLHHGGSSLCVGGGEQKAQSGDGAEHGLEQFHRDPPDSL